ncbi:MAG: hypothetical protein LBG27_06190 [Spirochaetaceae bacterium]|jgi:hypothetical protein|nr:hypothetical protein [Spirochaetaceae bacterium]
MRKMPTPLCRRAALITALAAMFLFYSCTSLVEFAGRKLSGGPYQGGVTIDETRGLLFYSQAFYRGWIEFTADYIADEGIVAITAGALRRDDTVIKGEEALGILRNRLNRINALTEWMTSSSYARRSDTQKDFEAYWRTVLLPETVSRKKRPALFPAENTAVSGDAAAPYAEGYRWNTAYTALLFPTNENEENAENAENAELAKMRDSGAMLRDFDEAALWIYFQYERGNVPK